MAETYTSNLELVKPDYNSPADIFVINSNMDKIDNAVANVGKVKSVNGKTGDVSLSASDVGALPSDGTAANANQLNGNSADKFAQIELEEAEDAGDVLRTNADLLGGKSLAQIMLMMYPVGAIYTSTVATSPAALFGGTWEQLKDRFLLGAGDVFPAGENGGERYHTLTTAEMPKHTHAYAGSGDNEEYTWEAPNMRVRYIYTAKNPYPDNVLSNASGGGEGHNNMPPYLSVYMWKRTA